MRQVIKTSNGIRHVPLSCSVCQPAVIEYKEIPEQKQIDYKAMYEELKRKVQLEKAERRLKRLNEYTRLRKLREEAAE